MDNVGDRAEFLKTLEANGIHYEEYRTELRDSITLQYMRAMSVSRVVEEKFLPLPDNSNMTDEQKTAYWHDRIEKMTPEQKKALHEAKEQRAAEWSAELRSNAFIKIL